MAHKKGQGSTRNGRDSNPKYLGIKLAGGQFARAGSQIVRQCGTRFKAGYLVQRSSNDSLHALVDGTVQFRGRFVDILPADVSIPRYIAVGQPAAN